MPRNALAHAALSLAALLPLACSGEAPVDAASASGADQASLAGPGPVPVDRFHPDRERAVTPGYGGTATIHLHSLPRNGLCYPVENSAYASWILNEVHEPLLERDWETWKLEPVLAREVVVEDRLELRDGEGSLSGRVEEAGDAWRVVPLAAPGEAILVPKEQAASVERGTVITLRLRDDVRWQDGHAFDADDVVFSWGVYRNPYVDCDSVRAYYEKIESAEALDEHTVRFVYGRQYFKALETIASLCVLPAHLYDLHDPDNADRDSTAGAEACAAAINDNPHNFDWVGLGPYRVVSFDAQGVEAERVRGYFDPARGGHLDRLRWRAIGDDGAAFQALLAGDIDFFFRLNSDLYFGPETRSEPFTRSFYKGYFYTPAYNYTAWNASRPRLADVRVRRALAHAFDLEEWVQTVGHGLAEIVTGPQFFFGPSYDHSVEPLAFDLERADELLTAAGWYDRDGDGLREDADGLVMDLEFPHSGNLATTRFAQKFQENLAKLGVRLHLEQHDWAAFYERVLDRDYDLVSLAWTMDLESDPEQYFHSRGAEPGRRGSNRSATSDAHVDELIARGQRELDPDRRHAIWRELHRYLFEEVQPYLFREMPPRKFAMNRALRGFQAFSVNPGFSARRWYYPVGTPGIRASRDD